MTNKDQIIIEFSADHPHLVENLKKLTSYVSYLMNEKTNSNLAIEDVKNGIIFFYSDFEVLKQVTKIYSKSQILDKIKRNNPKIDPKMILAGTISEQNFPSNGIQYRYKIIQGRKEEIIELYKKYFKGILNKDDSFDQHEDFDIVVHFKSFESFYLNTQLISTSFTTNSE